MLKLSKSSSLSLQDRKARIIMYTFKIVSFYILLNMVKGREFLLLILIAFAAEHTRHYLERMERYLRYFPKTRTTTA
jgi:hypothetical protein